MSPVNISSHQKQLEFEDNQFLSSLFGYHDKNLKVFNRDDPRRIFNLGNRLWHSDSSFKKIPANLALLKTRGESHLKTSDISMFSS